METVNIWKKIQLAGASLLLLVTLFNANVALAQRDDMDPRVGIKGGVNLSNLYINDVSDESAKLGYHAGLWFKIPVAPVFALQPEILWTTAGTKIGGYNVAGGAASNQINFNLNYIQVPVLASLTAGPISLQAGPYVSYLVSANVKNLRVDNNGIPTNDPNNTNSTVDVSRKNFNLVDYGLSGGLVLDIKGFQLGARYNYGLRNIGQGFLANTVTAGSKNQVLNIFVGVGL